MSVQVNISMDKRTAVIVRNLVNKVTELFLYYLFVGALVAIIWAVAYSVSKHYYGIF